MFTFETIIKPNRLLMRILKTLLFIFLLATGSFLACKKTDTVNPGGGVTPNPVPTITAISPASVTAGDPAFTLTISGTNFISGSTVNWNGTALSTTYISATQLTANITAPLVANPGSANITVVNGTPGGGTSNTIVSMSRDLNIEQWKLHVKGAVNTPMHHRRRPRTTAGISRTRLDHQTERALQDLRKRRRNRTRA